MLKQTLLFFIVFASAIYPLRSQNMPIGAWTDHLPYGQAIAVCQASDRLWCATPAGLFAVFPDNEFSRLSKVNGLTETGIQTTAYSNSRHALLVAYQNGNIDIVRNEAVTNIPDFKNASTQANKTIHAIYCRDNAAYLATGIGIVVIHIDKNEIADTYRIGQGGSEINCYSVCADNSFLYAGTDEGLLQTAWQGPNPSDFRNWTSVSGTAGLPSGSVTLLSLFQDRLVAAVHDSLYIRSGSGNWSLFYAGGLPPVSLQAYGDRLLVCESGTPGGRISILDANGNLLQQLTRPDLLLNPKQSIFAESEYWIADSLSGLLRYDGSNFSSYIPNAPAAPAQGPLLYANNVLWAASGAFTGNGQPAGNRNGLFRLEQGNWTNINRRSQPLLDSLPDLVALAADPVSHDIWVGSYGGGLLRIAPTGDLELFKQQSGLLPDPGTGAYQVSGLAADASGNLWICNAGAPQPLALRLADGSWQNFSIPFPISTQALGQIVIDDLNQLWIVGRNGQGLLCYQPGNSLPNSSDDNWKWYQAGQGNGNLPDNQVNCIAKDRNNFIWVGTNRGIGIIQCPQAVFSGPGCEAILPVVQQDNFAGYLFRDEQVQAMAVDGANRKWIGTRNGVWLISADAEKTIYHFTSSNSPLPNNNVLQIAINGQSGEVFFATASGICSFRSTATEATPRNENVLVFPNPVPPNYTGSIAIRGLAENAYVKITEPNGRLVYETRALGGQAIWNGFNYKGQRASTGVYLVLVRDESRQEKVVTKIVMIGK